MNAAAMVAKWAPILRVADWRITTVEDPELKAPLAGFCERLANYKEAIITVGTWLDARTLEETVVHELLHLHMAPFETKNDSPERVWEEQAVESITRGIIDLSRNGAPVAAVQRYARKRLASKRAIVAQRGTMDAKRYGEIMMELGSMDLDAKAKALVAELAGMTMGADETEPADAPEEKIPPPGEDEAPPLAAKAVAKMQRNVILAEKTEKLLARQYGRALINEARERLGGECTPVFERRLLAATPDIAEALLEGATSRGPARKSIEVTEGEARNGSSAVPLRSGEKEATISDLQKMTRLRLVAQLGPEVAQAALDASSGVARRTIGRPRKGS